MSITYEHHIHSDPDFPIIFHTDTLFLNKNDVLMHWHENIEILYFRDGKAVVDCDTISINAKEGDIIFINSGSLHCIQSESSVCEYDCLIADKRFCEGFGFPLGESRLISPIRDEPAQMVFDCIKKEMTEKTKYYKIAVKANVFLLLARLYRVAESNTVDSAAKNNRLNMVRDSIAYIRNHYKENITIEDICNHIGFSKYYFCRTFREITGKTVLDTINHLRCDHARRLIETGRYNISESAEMSGFNNKSYFSKIYKKYMGLLPSETN